MKLSFALMSIAALLLAGCTRPVVKETVIERPVVVDRGAAGGSTIAACTYASQAYSHGSVSCQDRMQYRCDNGIWNRTLNAC
jgi:hypothetical protein